jgi:hypothetical protein
MPTSDDTQEPFYSDVELRMAALPHAVALVNTEVQRTLQRCNTAAIADITKELVDVLKYGSVLKVAEPPTEEVAVDRNARVMKPKSKKLQYA